VQGIELRTSTAVERYKGETLMHRTAPVALVFAFVAACSSSSSSNGIDLAQCPGLAHVSLCAIEYAVAPKQTTSSCADLPGDVFELNASASSYTNTSGGHCTQAFVGCTLTRQCEDSTTSTLVATFAPSGDGGTDTAAGTFNDGSSGCAYTIALNACQ
jgi:hypothetical protein